MKSISIHLSGIEPVPKGRPRFCRRGNFVTTYTDKKTKDHEIRLKKEFRRMYMRQPLTGALHVEIIFYLKKAKSNKDKYPTTKADIDNFIKQVMDAGNEILWKDDCQIVKLQSEKLYSDAILDTGAIIVNVWELEGE